MQPAAAALDRRRPAARAGHRARRRWRSAIPFLTTPHRARRSCRCSARSTCPARCSSTSACSRVVVGATLLILTALAHQSLRSRARSRPPAQAAPPHEAEARLMEVVIALAIGVLGRLGRLAAAAPAHLPGDHRAVAAVVRGQPVHLQHGQPRRSTRSRSSCAGVAAGPAALHRPAAAGAGADRDRDRLRDHRAVPGGAAGLARPDRHRPRRRRRGAADDAPWLPARCRT